MKPQENDKKQLKNAKI